VDLSFTPEQEAFRAEARAWLAEHVPAERFRDLDSEVGFVQHRAWERELFDARWSVVDWPEEHGGRGADLAEWLIFEAEYYGAGAPGRVNNNGISLLGTTLLEYGTPEQQQRFLRATASGEIIWAQAWSEPNAGSDLASVKATARRDGDDWILNGQKTWSSRAAYADWLFGLFRSDPDAAKPHQGLTYFLCPLDAPGITRRPIGRLDGEPAFAEIFLEDVRVPADQVLGGVHEGWKVAMSTTGAERGLRLRAPGRFQATAARLVDLYRSTGGGIDPGLRGEVAQAWMDAEAYDLYTWKAASHVMAGGTIGPESSLNKLWWSEMDIRIHETALRLLGPRGELAEGAPDAEDLGSWLTGYLFSLSGPIYAGTNEIQRNVIAERVLDLPRR
jgi:alkylation response protein AidB-like acyl-CoA dehydrogenase